MSAREIEDIAHKAAKKEGMKELNRDRVSPPLGLEIKIFMMSRLGIPANRIASRLKVNRLTAHLFPCSLLGCPSPILYGYFHSKI